MSLIAIRSVNCAWSDTVPLRFAWACIRRPPSWLPLGRGHKDYGHNGLTSGLGNADVSEVHSFSDKHTKSMVISFHVKTANPAPSSGSL
ncbi:unnamed protein product [Arctia plantaginis]|uniref:Uncharacterized protein n=1 Tax=Arctia plantaginis TaxID=874455 RepID=A0A8S1AGZ5_ARCPL|nr:unnamed protein product [Arctia plantaginis]